MAGHGHDGPGGHAPVGEDKTPPANLIILGVTIFSVISLAAAKPAFDAYFDWMKRDVTAERIEEQTQRADERGTSFRAQREAWDNQLRENAETPIEEAVAQLGRRGRLAWPTIRPEASRADGPAVGWGPLAEIRGPALVQPELPPPPPPTPAPAPELEPGAEGAAPDAAAPDAAAPDAEASPEAANDPNPEEAAPQDQ